MNDETPTQEATERGETAGVPIVEEIAVPDIEGPTVQLCWKESPLMVRCTIKKGHLGPHLWERQQANIGICLRCGRAPSDLIHDSPNDHGWTGTGAMHPFVDERGKNLLHWTAWNVDLQGKSGQKGRHLDDDGVKWNAAIARAKQSVDEMLAPLTPDALAEHDRYFAEEYAKRNAVVHERIEDTSPSLERIPVEGVKKGLGALGDLAPPKGDATP